MATMKKGAAMIATELNLPIVPVYIDGTTRLSQGLEDHSPDAGAHLRGEAIDPHRFAEKWRGGRSTASPPKWNHAFAS